MVRGFRPSCFSGHAGHGVEDRREANGSERSYPRWEGLQVSREESVRAWMAESGGDEMAWIAGKLASFTQEVAHCRWCRLPGQDRK